MPEQLRKLYIMNNTKSMTIARVLFSIRKAEIRPTPRVVGIQSTENWGGSDGPNTCGGGNPLSELIN